MALASLKGQETCHGGQLPEQFEATMSCRIDRRVTGEDLVVLCISGRISRHDVRTLRDVMQQEASAFAIDLNNVFLIDRGAVQLLARREANGTELRNCPLYIREWITRERAEMNTDPTEMELSGNEIEDV